MRQFARLCGSSINRKVQDVLECYSKLLNASGIDLMDQKDSKGNNFCHVYFKFVKDF